MTAQAKTIGLSARAIALAALSLRKKPAALAKLVEDQKARKSKRARIVRCLAAVDAGDWARVEYYAAEGVDARKEAAAKLKPAPKKAAPAKAKPAAKRAPKPAPVQEGADPTLAALAKMPADKRAVLDALIAAFVA